MHTNLKVTKPFHYVSVSPGSRAAEEVERASRALTEIINTKAELGALVLSKEEALEIQLALLGLSKRAMFEEHDLRDHGRQTLADEEHTQAVRFHYLSRKMAAFASFKELDKKLGEKSRTE